MPAETRPYAFPPPLAWVRHYQAKWLRADVIAGVVAAAVVIPMAMAYASIVGLPVQVGLYTAIIPMVVYAALGTSCPLSVSTTTTIAILTGATLLEAVPKGSPTELASAAASLAVLVGAILLLASLFRLGFVANFISDPVLVGFKSGIGVVILVIQLPKLLGFPIARQGILQDLVAIVRHLPETSVITLMVAIPTLLLLVGLERWRPRVPAPLIAVTLGIAASGLLGLSRAGVGVVGFIPRELPYFVLPQFSLFARIWPGAAGIALISFVEGIAAARAFAEHGEPRPIPNREILAIGSANAAGGLFGAMPSGGGATQTAVNRDAGAHTQLAGLVTATMALGTILLLAPLLSLLPSAVLAAVVVTTSAHLIQPAEFARIARVRKEELWWAFLAFTGVILLGTLRGIAVAVVASLLTLALQSYDPTVYVLGRKRGTDAFRPASVDHPDDETWPGLLILRPEGRLFFANVYRFSDKVWVLLQRTRAKVLLIDCSAVIDIEYTALRALSEAEESLRRAGITLWLAGLNPNVLESVRRTAIGAALGRERMFFNLQIAVGHFGAETRS